MLSRFGVGVRGLTGGDGGGGIAPVLSGADADPTSSTEVLLFAVTDQGTGALYAILSEVDGLPSAAQVKAGLDSTGAPVDNQNQAIVSPGSKAFSFTGLASGTTYFGYLMHENAAGLQSLVAASGAVTPHALSLPIWHAALDASQIGGGRARLLCIGDSTTLGLSVTRANAYPRQLAALLPGGSELSWLSDGNAANQDPRMVIGAGWAANSSKGVGGFLYANTTTTNALVFTPQSAFDTVEIFKLGSNQVTVTVGAAAPVTTTGGSGSILSKFTISLASLSLAPGVYPISIVRSGSTVIFGLNAYTSASGVAVWNAGTSGWLATDFVGANTFDTASSITSARINPHLTLINIGINDFNKASPTAEATYKAQMQELISAVIAAGSDCLLIIPHELGSANAGNRAAFAGFINDLVATNSLQPAIDLSVALGTYADANAAGYMLDTIHPSASGYTEIANYIHSWIA